MLMKANLESDVFKNGTLGTRRVFTGSLFEGSLEARQAKDTMLADLSDRIDDDMTNEGVLSKDREEEKAKRMIEGVKLADQLGLGILALNVGLLSVSNAIQFPTIFGKKAYEVGKKVDRNYGAYDVKKLMAEGADGLATDVKSSFAARAGNKAIMVAKNPISEFMEETLQGVVSNTNQNYFERVSLASSDNKGLDAITGSYFEDFTKAFNEQYTTTEGISQGMIGAIVGALGLPVMRKNKNGNYRPGIEGGIWKDAGLSISGKEERSDLKAEKDAARNALAPENMIGALVYNRDQTILNDKLAREENKAGYQQDNDRMNELQDDKVFAHVANFKDKGLSSYLVEQMEAMEAMSVEEYAERTRGPESEEEVTEEIKEKELKDLSEKMNSYSDAYDKVHKGMNMDKMNSNSFTDKLFKNLTYSLATEKVTLAEYDQLSKKLRSKGALMSESDLYDLAVLYKDFGQLSEKEIVEELDSMNTDSKRSVFYDYQQDRGFSLNDLKGSPKSLRKSAKLTLSSIENDSDFDSVRAKLDAIDNMSEEAGKNGKNFLQNSSVYKKAKESLSDENVSKLTDKKSAEKKEENGEQSTEKMLEVADKYQRKQSEIMDELIGKKKRLTRLDLERYSELKAKYTNDLSEKTGVPKSFLDSLDEQNGDENEAILRSMSSVASRREESLKAASALYGIGNVSESLNKIARAEFRGNIQNVQYYMRSLAIINRSDEDDKDAARTTAYNKLEYSKNALKTRLKEFEEMSKVEEGEEDPMSEMKEQINELITESEGMLAAQKEYFDASDG
jgi:hypothetical protein